MPQVADLIIAARWVVPVEPAGSVLEDHAVRHSYHHLALIRAALKR
jgi:hypothetical protein